MIGLRMLLVVLLSLSGGCTFLGFRTSVGFDEEKVWHKKSFFRSNSIPWGELQQIIIRSEPKGASSPRLYFLIMGRGRPLTVPWTADNMEEFLARLYRLPGFDLSAVIRARTGHSNGRRVIATCWRRKD